MKNKSLVIPLVLGIAMATTVLVLEFRSATPSNGTDALAAALKPTEAPLPEPPETSTTVDANSRPKDVDANSRPNDVDADSRPKGVDADSRPRQQVESPRQQIESPRPKVSAVLTDKPVAKRTARAIPKNRQVILAHRTIAVEKRKFPTRFCTTQTPTARGTAPYVLVSELAVDRTVQSQAMADGARIVGCLPHNALLVEATAEALRNLSEDAMFLAAVEYEPLDKLQPELLKCKDEKVAVNVTLMNAAYRDATCAFVTANQGLLIEENSKRKSAPKSFAATIPRKLVNDLARKSEIRWIEKRK